MMLVNAWSRSERGGKTIVVVVGPHSTTRHGDSSYTRGAPLEGPSQCDLMVWVHEELWVLSLSVAGIWAKF